MDSLFNRIIFVATQIIWYILPGFMLMFICVFPFVIISPQNALPLLNDISGAMWIIIGILLGFVLEGLRLYRIRPYYNKIKKQFFEELQSSFRKKNKSRSINPYFILDQIYDLATEKKYDTIRLYHSIWILLGQLSIILCVAGVIYFPAIAIFSYKLLSVCLVLGINVTVLMYILIWGIIIALTIVMGIRIMVISLEEQKKVNSMYLEFMNSNLRELERRLFVYEEKK